MNNVDIWTGFQTPPGPTNPKRAKGVCRSSTRDLLVHNYVAVSADVSGAAEEREHEEDGNALEVLHHPRGAREGQE